jgi:hypothetical protein
MHPTELLKCLQHPHGFVLILPRRRKCSILFHGSSRGSSKRRCHHYNFWSEWSVYIAWLGSCIGSATAAQNWQSISLLSWCLYMRAKRRAYV